VVRALARERLALADCLASPQAARYLLGGSTHRSSSDASAAQRKSAGRAVIIRTSPRRSYTALPNAIFRDRRMALDTKGLLGYLLSLPPNWEIRPQVIAKALSPADGRPVGRERLQRMFSEMKAAGYMVRSKDQGHGDGGYWGSFSYIVGADPETVKQEAEAQGVAFLPQSALPSTAEPSTAEPSAANPAADKRKKDNNQSKLKTERPEFQYADAAILEIPQGLPANQQRPNGYRSIHKRKQEIHRELAQRLGAGDDYNGWLMLGALSESQRDQLSAQARAGTLDDAEIDRVRALVLLARSGGG
jgi:hypothetical protein